MANPRPVRSASAATRKFFDVLTNHGVSQSELSKRTGIHVNTIMQWRSGKAAANVINMEAALQILGLEFTIQPIHQPQTEELPL